MINTVLRWSFAHEGWNYRLECIPRMDSFVPVWTPATDITAVSGYTDMPELSLIKRGSLEDTREYAGGIPLGMQLAAEMKFTLDWSQLTTAQREVINKPAVNIGSNEGIDYILTNVWTLYTDRGSSGVTWYAEYQGAQRRIPEIEYTYDLANSNTPTEIELTLYDIRRVLMERVEIDVYSQATRLANQLPTAGYQEFFIHANGTTSVRYASHTVEIGRGVIGYTMSLATLLSTQQTRLQTLYRYLTRNASSTVVMGQPYGTAVTFYQQNIDRYMIRLGTSLAASDLRFTSEIFTTQDYADNLPLPDPSLRIGGMFSESENSFKTESPYIWDTWRLLTEYFLVKETYSVMEIGHLHLLTISYHKLLANTENPAARTLANDEIRGQVFKMKRGGATIRKVEYANNGATEDERDAVITEAKGSASERGFSVQGVFSNELEIWQRYDKGELKEVGNLYVYPSLFKSIGINSRKLVYLYQTTANGGYTGYLKPHGTADIDIGLGSVTLGTTGSLVEDWADFYVKSEAEYIRLLQNEQDNTSYGSAVGRVLLHLFGNEDNRVYSLKLDFDTSTNSYLPLNIGDVYTIPAGWLTEFGGDALAVVTKCKTNWLDRTIEVELLNVYDNDITGA